MTDAEDELARKANAVLHRELGMHRMPSGGVRLLSDGVSTRLQIQWIATDSGKSLWLDVPTVIVDALPPEQF